MAALLTALRQIKSLSLLLARVNSETLLLLYIMSLILFVYHSNVLLFLIIRLSKSCKRAVAEKCSCIAQILGF